LGKFLGKNPRRRRRDRATLGASVHAAIAKQIEPAKNEQENLHMPATAIHTDVYLSEADALSRNEKLSSGQRSRISYLLAASKASREGANGNGGRSKRTAKFSDLAEHRPDLRAYGEWLLRGYVTKETRDMVAGTQGVGTYSDGADGGYLVPQEMYAMLINAIAQADPLFDENVVRLITEPGLTPLRARPIKISGWDTSSASAVQVTEAAPEAAVTPTVGGGVLNGFLFREEIAASLEFEQDASIFMEVMDLMFEYFQQAFLHGIGAALCSGSGSGAPQGVTVGATNSTVTTAGAGAITAGDLEKIFFSLNRAYRARPKCAWLMSDTIYLQCRKAADTNGRPLIDIVDGRELIFGKPVLISPTISSTAGQIGIIFGDLSHFCVRLSGMQLLRTTQTTGAGSATYGAASFKGRQRADSVVFDPSGGSTPPIVYATLHS
jgi:HK97 family phage major capsid protein